MAAFLFEIRFAKKSALANQPKIARIKTAQSIPSALFSALQPRSLTAVVLCVANSENGRQSHRLQCRINEKSKIFASFVPQFPEKISDGSDPN